MGASEWGFREGSLSGGELVRLGFVPFPPSQLLPPGMLM